VIGAISAVSTLGLLSVAMASTAAAGPDAAAVHALGDLLLKAGGGYTLAGATCFAVGSTLLVAGLPLQLAGFLSGPATHFMWIPMAVFEVTFALWLLIKGVATTPKRISPELGDVTA
jgi:hypothetical protein